MKANRIALVLIPLVLCVCAILIQGRFVAADNRSPATTIRTEDSDVGMNPTRGETRQDCSQTRGSGASSSKACPSGKMSERGAFGAGVIFALNTITYMRNNEVRRASPDRKDSLAGVKGVTIVVGMPQEVKQCGLTQRQLRTDTELRLRQEGIRVLTSDEVDQSITNAKKKQQERWQDLGLKILSLPEALTQNDSDQHFWRCLRPLIPEYLQETCGPPPFLSVNFNPIVSEEDGRVVFSIDLKLNEAVYVRRNGALRVAAIWDTGAVAACESSDLEEHARECLRDCLDAFINDYLAANPKDRAG